jgi:lysozyme family protein
MTIQDILDAASGYSTSFQKALATVLPEECEFGTDGVTIRKERPDSHGWTFAGLNQKDDGLPVDESGNVTATPQWIADTYYEANDTGSTGYWLPTGCNMLPSPINILVFCQAVNEGIGVACLQLQFSINQNGGHLVVDGKVGPATCNAAMACPDSNTLARTFLEMNREHYRNIVAHNASFQKDLQGWLNRVDGLQKQFC